MRDSAEKVTWPIRKLVWRLERSLVWKGADSARSGLDSAKWPFRRLRWAVERRILWPLQDAVRNHGRARRLALAGLLAAVAAAGVGGAVLIAGLPSSGEPVPSGTANRPVQAAAVNITTATGGGAATTLHGAPPNFKSAPAEAETSSDPAAQPAARVAEQKPSAIPAAPGGEAGAMKTASEFSGAFVLYEVGAGGHKVKATFSRTATRDLAKALAQRPPRLPGKVDVPRARVLNVILGERQKRQLDASVSLLRLGNISELRLTLIRAGDGWAVSEVRG